MTLAANRSNGRFGQAGPRTEVVQDDSQARYEGNWRGPMTNVGQLKSQGRARTVSSLLPIWYKHLLHTDSARTGLNLVLPKFISTQNLRT